MNVLFITHEGIDSSIFNSQVLTHARTLKNDGINIDILSFNTNEKSKLLSINNFNKLLKQDLDIKIILKFGVNIYLPFSSLLNGVLLVLFFIQNKEKYSLIHCRSDYTSFLGILTKFIHKKRIIWDCRGDSYNELKDTLSKKGYLIKLIGNLFLKPINLMEIFISSTYSDASIFVSKALYRSHSNILKTKNWKIIPCLVSEDIFFFNNELRAYHRKNLGIGDNDCVFLYSGSLASYQALNLQEGFYNRLLMDSNNFIIFATVDVIQAKKYFDLKFDHRFIILNIPFDKMNNYYNLADFAILLREDKLLNYVASPTKFGEYCLTGLPVIMNDTIEQSSQFSKELGNYVNWNDFKFNKFNVDQRIEISYKAKFYFSRKELNKQYIELYQSLI